MIDHLASLAQMAAGRMSVHDEFELLHGPEFGCVVFRYVPREPSVDADAVNRRIVKDLFDSGRAVLGHTVINQRACLKLTFCNPCTTGQEIGELLEMVRACGEQLVATDATEAMTAHG